VTAAVYAALHALWLFRRAAAKPDCSVKYLGLTPSAWRCCTGYHLQASLALLRQRRRGNNQHCARLSERWRTIIVPWASGVMAKKEGSRTTKGVTACVEHISAERVVVSSRATNSALPVSQLAEE